MSDITKAKLAVGIDRTVTPPKVTLVPEYRALRYYDEKGEFIGLTREIDIQIFETAVKILRERGIIISMEEFFDSVYYTNAWSVNAPDEILETLNAVNKEIAKYFGEYTLFPVKRR